MKNSDLIFVGIPISKEEIFPIENQPPDFKYLFIIEEIIKREKDSIAEKVKVFTEDSSFRCGFPIQMNEKQVIFAKKENDEYFTFCANNNFVVNEETLYRLNYIKEKASGGRKFDIIMLIFISFLIMISITNLRKK